MGSEFDEDPWVTLTTIPSREELGVVRGMLESAGIECFCPEQVMSSYYGIGMQARVQVRSSQLVDAQALLDSPFQAPEES